MSLKMLKKLRAGVKTAERGCVADQPQHVVMNSTLLKSGACCGWSRTTQPRSFFKHAQMALAALIAAGMLSARAVDYSVASPDGRAVVKLTCTDSELSYTLSWQGRTLLESSRIALLKQSAYTVLGVETNVMDSTWKPVWGQFSQIRDHCRQLTLKLKASGVRMDLICRVYDDGVGLRFSVPAQSELAGKALDWNCEFNAAGDFAAYAPAGEQGSIGPVSIAALAGEKPRSAPIVLDAGGGQWLALLESDLYSATLFSSAKFAIQGSRVIQNQARLTASAAGFVTPWKVITLGQSPGDLVANTVTLNLAPACQLADASWVKAGKTVWDWRVHGYNNGDFKYGVDTQSYLRFIDFAASHGIQYLTIDDMWFTVPQDNVIQPVPAVDIQKVMQHARDKGVKVFLYYDRKKLKSPGATLTDAVVFKTFHDLGAVGIKYGFMGDKAEFTRDAIKGAADQQLMILFHDGPVPMSGVERTMPNMVSREYCHGQQDGRRAFTPTAFLKMAMINALTGPLDQANGNFGLKGINVGEREKGPRKQNSYISTVVSEVARVLIISSGLIALPDAPEEYSKKADLFEFIQQMPATWDETRVLHSKMGEYITTARRTGETWFVGSVNNETKARELPIPLTFLDAGKTYQATLFQDTQQTDGIKNPEAYEVLTKPVKAGDTITARMALGGGHALILRPSK